MTNFASLIVQHIRIDDPKALQNVLAHSERLTRQHFEDYVGLDRRLNDKGWVG